MNTTIKISKENRDKLEKFKSEECQDFNQVIAYLLKNSYISEEASNDVFEISKIEFDLQKYMSDEFNEKNRAEFTSMEIRKFLNKMNDVHREMSDKDMAVRNPEYFEGLKQRKLERFEREKQKILERGRDTETPDESPQEIK